MAHIKNFLRGNASSLIKLDNEEESEKIKHATGLRSKKKKQPL